MALLLSKNGGNNQRELSKDSNALDLSQFDHKIVNIDDLLEFCTEHSCSDLYIKVGETPVINRWGKIHNLNSFPISLKIWKDWAKIAISSENNAKYVRSKMLDLSYVIPKHVSTKDGVEETKEIRYRVSAGFSLGKNIATFRMINEDLPSFKSICFPKQVEEVLHQSFGNRQGIILFVGVTGSGKTTTMAAALNDFTKIGQPLENSTIISLEDPVEYVIPSVEHVNILQKELGIDFKTWLDGIKQSLREHPNFVNVGETRDQDTIEALVEAARTGHGVVSSFHASDVADTISRMYNMLTSRKNDGIMHDLISNLNLILCQQLVASDNGFDLRTQYVVFNNKVRNVLLKALSNHENIPMVVNNLLEDDELLDSNLVQNWK